MSEMVIFDRGAAGSVSHHVGCAPESGGSSASVMPGFMPGIHALLAL
jgi:hypothetical protein